MIAGGCEEVVLEAEVVNTGALKLYQGLGFVREKRLHRCETGKRRRQMDGRCGVRLFRRWHLER